MCCKGVFKRVVPFLLTFCAGLFIASFFVTIASPNFGGFRRQSKYRQMRQVRMEVEELRRERTRLKEEIENLQNERNTTVQSVERLPDNVYEVPPPPPVPTVKLKKLSK
jgi:cell division protein FtsB